MTPPAWVFLTGPLSPASSTALRRSGGESSPEDSPLTLAR
jgi:hypothetical protein